MPSTLFRNGADAHAIMRQTGHTTPWMVEIYARENAPLVGNAGPELVRRVYQLKALGP